MTGPRRATAARPKRGGLIEGERPEDKPAQGLAPDELSDDVERLLAALGENTSGVTIYREDDERPGRWNYLSRTTADEFTTDGLEYLKQTWGGGNYKLVVTDSRHGPLNPCFVSIDARFTGKAFANAGGQLAGMAPRTSTFEQDIMRILLARLMEPPRAVDPLATALQIVGVINQSQRPAAPLGDTLASVKAMLELARELNPGDNDQDPTTAAINAFAPAVGPLVAKILGGADTPVASPPAAQPILPPPTLPHRVFNPPTAPLASPSMTDGPVRTVPAPVQPTVPAWLAPFSPFRRMLVDMADSGADPALYADMCVDQVINDDNLFAQALSAVESSTLQRDVFSMVPEFATSAPRQAWGEAFCAEVTTGLQTVLAGDNNGTGSGASSERGGNPRPGTAN